MNEAQRARFPRIRVIAGLVFLAIFLLLTIVIFVYFFYFFPWYTRVHVSGIVLDDDTNEPVAHARVVINLRRNGYPFEIAVGKFGVEAKGDGSFSVDIASTRRFNRISIEASSPSNTYGHIDSPAIAEGVVVRTSLLPQRLQEMTMLQYENFYGVPQMGLEGIEFIDDGWGANER